MSGSRATTGKADRFLCSKQIAAELGCSQRTISRLYQAGQLPNAFKLNSNTSPIRMRERDLRRLLRGK